MTILRSVIGGATFLVMASVSVHGQTTVKSVLESIHCPPLAMIPVVVERMAKDVKQPDIDSTVIYREREVASLYTQIKGRWLLYQVQGGWGSPKRPDRKIDMSVDEIGNAVISEKHKQLAVFQFKLRRDWQSIYTPVDGRSQSFFIGMTRGLMVELCQDTLILNEAIGDGMEYVFRRTITN